MMTAWIVALTASGILGIWSAACWSRKRRRQREPLAGSEVRDDLDDWLQEKPSEPEMPPWYGWRRELRLALREEDFFAGLVMVAIVLALAAYGLWNLFR